MALWRAAGLCRLALRSQWTAARLLSSVGVGGEPLNGEPPSGEDKRRRVDLAALRACRPPVARPPLVYATSLGRTSDATVQLNKAILACDSADAVLDLVAPQLASLSAVNASTALMTIQRRLDGEPTAWLRDDASFAQLLTFAASVFEHMQPQSLVNSLLACGKLGVAPPAEWLERFWHFSAATMGEFNPQALTNTLYACSRLSIKPPADWLQRYWDASASKLGTFSPLALTNTLYACGLLCIKPPADWLQRFWDASPKLNDFNAQDLAKTLRALSQLGITPPVFWLQRFWGSSAVHMGEFTPQNLSNTLYACGQLGITPPADWMERFWHASALKLGAFKPQELSNTLHACGLLGITPPDDWLLRYWHASLSSLGEFIALHFAKTLYACGQLSIVPPADCLQAFVRECERALPDMNQQDLANTTFALANLALWELPLWPGLWERLCCLLSRNIPNWNAEDRLHATQLYQAYTAAAVERPGLLPAPSPELLAAARKSWVDKARLRQAEGESRLQADISACLTRMGVAHANEHWCERAERSIDISIEGAVPVALEVDGPTHFLQDGRQDGSTLLRNRMLAAHGWRVVVVDYRSWNEMKTLAQQEELVRRLLA